MADVQTEAREALDRANAGVEAIVNEVKAQGDARDDEKLGELLIDVGTSAMSVVVLSLRAIADRVDALVSVLESGTVSVDTGRDR
jgi:hypothetical protein